MISATMLSSYLYCSRKLYLEYVLKVVEPPREVLLLGRIRHKVIEEASKNEEGIVSAIKKKLGLKDIAGLYRGLYSSILTEELAKRRKELDYFKLKPEHMFNQMLERLEPEILFRAGNVFDFIEKNNVFGEKLWLDLTPKIKSEIRIESPLLDLVGVIDQLHVYEDRLVPFELKTGKTPAQGVWPGHRIQIAAYLLLLEERFGRDMQNGFVKYLDSDSVRQITMNPFLREEVLDLIKKIKALLSSKELPDFCGNDNKCMACGIKNECLKLSQKDGGIKQ